MNALRTRRCGFAAALVLALVTVPSLSAQHERGNAKTFRRIASFPVFLNTDANTQTVSEIVAAAAGGELLVYTDSEGENAGFVDIQDPEHPAPAGIVALPGEPTSVAVVGDYALVCVSTSQDFVNTSGELVVIDVPSRTIVRSLPLGGQPDAIAIDEHDRYAAIAIENERDEDLGDGAPPQLPAGFLVIVDLQGPVSNWSTRNVDLTGICTLFPEDPEPEYVSINGQGIAAVTCQENNHVILVRLSDGTVVGDFSCGTVDLTEIDTNENDLIEQVDSLSAIPREPDAVAWISNDELATADEGDLDGGSRGFTIFKTDGSTTFEAGNSLEHLVARLGHYPEGRSENKGNEPESVLYAEYGRRGRDRYLFVGSERSSVVAVYRLIEWGFGHWRRTIPVLVQVLPAGVGPEGLLAIPERNLFVVACEEDSREDKIRATVQIYRLDRDINYPTVVSANRSPGLPIPWGALSALATSPRGGSSSHGRTIYSAHDSFYRQSRIFEMRVRPNITVIENEIVLRDSNGVLLGALQDLKAQLPGTDDFAPTDLVNGDDTVNLDIEGLAMRENGGFWIASEGAGNLVGGVSDPDDRPFESPSLLARVSRHGVIEQVVLLPIEVVRDQLRFGFEGVAIERHQGHEVLFVAFQRAWQAAGDPADRARIGRYDTVSGEWTFAHYPLETPTSPNGGWVGLSELTALGHGRFAVIERDDQGGPDATIKLVTTFSTQGVTFKPFADVATFEVLTKSVARDIIASGDFDRTGGLIPEKLEGLTVLRNGHVLIVNDNDGVDDNNGETQLLDLGRLFH